MQRLGDRELLERELEHGVLQRATAAARAGDGTLVLVEGVAGIGKTALVSRALADGATHGVRALRACGAPREAGFPFGVVRQVFEPLVASLETDARTRAFAGSARLAAPLFDPVDPQLAPAPDAGYAMLHGLYWLAANLSAQTPCLIVVDDVQWADPPSLRWVEFLARRLDGLALALVLARRPGEDAAVDELARDLARDPVTVVVPLGPLSRAGTAQLVRRTFSDDATDAFCARFHAATGGNPLLVSQSAGELARRGVLPDDGAADRVTDLMTAAVAELVVSRLRDLGEDGLAVVAAVAVLGGHEDRARVAAVAGRSVEIVDQVLGRLNALDVLAADEQQGFRHPLVRAAVERHLGTATLAAAHRRAATVLADRGASAEEIASHVLLTAPTGDPWVVETLEAAAHAAAARGAGDSARAMLERAVAEPPVDATDRVRLQHQLGLLLVRQSDMLGAGELLSAALATSTDPYERARIATDLAIPLLAMRRTRESVQQLDTVRQELLAVDPRAAVALEAAAIANARWDLELGEDFVERLRAGRERAGTADAPGRLLLFLAGLHDIISGVPGGVGVAQVRAALDHGLIDDDGEHAPQFALACLMLVMGGELDGAQRHLAAAQLRVDHTGSALAQSNICNARARLRLARGALADAEADARHGLEVADVSIGMPTLLGSLVESLVLRGRLQEAADELARRGGDGPLPPLITCYLLVEARARLRAAQGDHRGALQDCELVAGWMTMAWARGPMPVFWQPLAVTSHLALGEHELARRRADEAIALAAGFGEPRSQATALIAHAACLPADEALVPLDAAAGHARTAGAGLLLAEATVGRGAVLRLLGQVDDARTVLREGLALALRCGAQPLAERANAELVASGARPRRMELAGPAALTAAELRVARAAADGLTNREVAERLFVTVKTVEMHLSSAYRKLGIGSRSQLAAGLRDRMGGTAGDP